MEATQRSGCQLVVQLVRFGIIAAVSYYCAKWLLSSMDPTIKAKKRAKELAQQQIKKLNAMSVKERKLKVCDFNSYELMIASHLIAPTDIDVSWSDIAGLDDVVQELRETVVLPVRHSDLFRHSQLWRPPKGVLLYGPPGCGKTLIAKAIAKEACMRFINLDVALLTDKWYGESQKLASAVFSLAQKLQPCIIFIDEIETFLRARAAMDHEATAMMKTQFMMLWDGLISGSNGSVMVLGATNRPQDLDKAILRRMPTQFHIGPPLERQRFDILHVILHNERLDPNVDLKRVAHLTKGYSGSDLRELCRHASVYCMRQFMQQMLPNDSSDYGKKLDLDENQLIIRMDDLLKALVTMDLSKRQTGNYQMAKIVELD